MMKLRTIRHSLPLCLALSLGLSAAAIGTPARADLWGYVDASGRSHMSTEKLDDRYQLFFKGGVRVNAPVAAAATPAADAKAQEALRNTPLFQRMIGKPNLKRFEGLIQQVATQHKVDPALVKAVIAVESAFQPDAVSPKGARGLMQVIPDTGARYGVAADRKRSVAQKLLDPAINLRVGTLHLSNLLALFPGNLELALAAYNAGENAVQRYDNKVPPYPETREYVKLVRQFYSLFQPAPAAAPAKAQMADNRIVLPGQRTAPGLAPKMLADAPATEGRTGPDSLDAMGEAADANPAG